MSSVSSLDARTGAEAPGRPSGDAARRTGGSRGRDPYLDNIKFCAIALVVIGHLWGALSSNRQVDGLYLYVYTFHMPVFVLVAGMLAPVRLTGARLRGILTAIVVPYLVFQPVYGAMLAWSGRPDSYTYGYLDPNWLMWFLAALLCWRLLAPLVSRLPGSVAIGLAVALSLAWGAIPVPEAELFALSRVFGLLPFFVLGLVLDPSQLRRLHTPVVRRAAVGLLAVGAVVAWALAPLVNHDWLYWRPMYDDLGVGPLEGVLYRSLALLAALLLSAAFLAVIPDRRLWFTDLGARTMYVYLLHGLVVLTLQHFGVLAAPALTSTAGALAMAVLGLALTLFLVWKPVRRLARPFVAPRLWWLWDGEPRLRGDEFDDLFELDERRVEVADLDPTARMGLGTTLGHPGMIIR